MGDSSITATEQTIPNKNIIDNSIPSFLRPMNTPLPQVNMRDIINNIPGLKPTATETEDIRQKRINKLDKKPLLAIESQSTQADAEDTIKLLEDILKPKTPTKPPPPASEPETTNTEPDSTSLDESPQLRELKDNFKPKGKYQYNWQMGKLLIDNNIKSENGNDFYINSHNQVLVKGSNTALKKDKLADYILKAFNEQKLINI